MMRLTREHTGRGHSVRLRMVRGPIHLRLALGATLLVRAALLSTAVALAIWTGIR